MTDHRLPLWCNCAVAGALCFAFTATAEPQADNSDFSKFVSLVVHRKPSTPVEIIDELHSAGAVKKVSIQRLPNQTKLTSSGGFQFGEITVRTIALNYDPGDKKIWWIGFAVAPNTCLPLQRIYEIYGKFEFGPVRPDSGPALPMHKYMPWGEYIVLYKDNAARTRQCVAFFRVLFGGGR